MHYQLRYYLMGQMVPARDGLRHRRNFRNSVEAWTDGLELAKCIGRQADLLVGRIAVVQPTEVVN